jgi:hypothetical protein
MIRQILDAVSQWQKYATAHKVETEFAGTIQENLMLKL